jgi:hypothetical protein
MTFVKALDELKKGETIYNKRYPEVCYQYTPHNEMLYKFRKGVFNNWYYDEDDSVGFQEILFDKWEVLDIDNLIFVY